MSDDDKMASGDRIETGRERDYLLTVLIAFLCGFAGACIVGFVVLWGRL